MNKQQMAPISTIHGPYAIGAMPKILVNGSSNFSIVDSIEAEPNIQKPIITGHNTLSEILVHRSNSIIGSDSSDNDSLSKSRRNSTTSCTSTKLCDNATPTRRKSNISAYSFGTEFDYGSRKSSFDASDRTRVLDETIPCIRRDSKRRHNSCSSNNSERRRKSSTVSSIYADGIVSGERGYHHRRHSHSRRHSARSDSVIKQPATATSIIVEMSPEALEKERRHRFIVSIIMGTFFFILIASILVVVITLTNHKPVASNNSLPHISASHSHGPKRFHRINVFTTTIMPTLSMRKENEELMHSLSYNNHAHNRSKLLTTLAPEIIQN